jgi:thiol-disulfide isomerase/thioredoxin
MRRWLAPLLALIILSAGALWYQQSASRVRGTFPAPNFTARDLEGRTVRLSDLRGKVVFLNLWATWCAPCREEMPSMEVLQRDLGGEDFVVLAVSEDQGGAAVVKPYVAEFGFTFPVLLSPAGEVGRKYGITGYPETFLIDKSGQVVMHYVGPRNWADNGVRAMLRHLIEAPAAPPA